ncbi:transporter substrate-binding domain-containing protein [Erysipelothrix sp. strain 2 (EsS2-7-Brazil)]|nr:transporter substrate-binding domain-containing protein [Erysipelothrix sp. strain 2 (EsS2-7-Brazil)]
MQSKNMKKVLLIFFVLLTITGCTNSSKRQDDLVVGMECNYAPFNWTQSIETEFTEPLSDGHSYCDGYDVQMARHIANELNRNLVIKEHAVFKGLLESAKVGDIDLIIAGMTNTEERRQEVDFTDVYYTSEMVLVTKKDSPYANATALSDFSGAHVSAQIGTMHDQLVDQIPSVNHGVPLESFPFLTTAVNNNAIDAFVSEKPVALAITSSNPNLAIVEFEGNNGFIVDAEEVTVSIGLAKGNDKLLDDVNAALSKLSPEQRDAMMSEAIKRQPSSSEDQTKLMPSGFFAGVGFLIQNNWKLFLNGLGITLLIALTGTTFGLIIGLVIAGLRQIKISERDKGITRLLKRLMNVIVTAYVQYLRGTPMMVQGILIYYGLRGLEVAISPLTAGIIIISINTSAYMSEIIRAGIQAIDKGQNEAARSLGMTEAQTLRYVILPQAIRNAIPAIGNEFVVNIKDSSVLNVITVSELFFQGNRLTGIYYRQMEPFFIVSLIYLVLTICSTQILNMIEKRMDAPKGSYPASVTHKVHFDKKEGGN